MPRDLRNRWYNGFPCYSVRFSLARNRLLDEPLSAPERRRTIAQISSDAIEIARALYKLTSEDSRIGFEASNQYSYRPIELAEKIHNCRYILDHRLPEWRD